MTKKNLGELLGYVNQMREALGEQPINMIRRGAPNESDSCPLANSLAGKIGVHDEGSLYCRKLEHYTAIAKVLPCTSAKRNDAGEWEFNLRGRARELFTRFVDQFDHGNRHLTNAFGER